MNALRSLTAAMALALTGWFFWLIAGKSGDASVHDASQAHAVSVQSARKSSNRSAAPSASRQDTDNLAPGADADAPQRSPVARETETQAILHKIHVAATTYDPAELKQIAPYLDDPNPEIRKEAIAGMITLGDASAGKLLRAAAKTARTDAEATELMQAADYVELPPVEVKSPRENSPDATNAGQTNVQSPTRP